MSIGNIQNNTWATPQPPSEARATNDEQSAPSALSRLNDTAGFSSVAPQLQAALAQMSAPEGSVVDTLTDNVSRLQDGFVDTLYATLSAESVDLSSKMTLKLNSDSQLQVTGSHPDKEKVDAILAAAPELSTAFSEISSQSAALRDIRSLHSTVLSNSGLGRYAAVNAAAAGDSDYQISIKGDMNHFYFTR